MIEKEILLEEGEDYTCPICGELILKNNAYGDTWLELEALMGPKVCSHLAFFASFGWDDFDTHFILVGQDYANRLVEKINEIGLESIKDMFELDYEITKDDISKFLNRKIPPEDELMGVFASLPFIKDLLHPDAIYYSESYGVGYSGIIMVIEPPNSVDVV